MQNTKNEDTKKMFIYWYIRNFSLEREVAKYLWIKENTIRQMLYRNSITKNTTKVVQFLKKEHNIDENIAFAVISKKEFLDYIKL